jgi:hypothetical protein
VYPATYLSQVRVGATRIAIAQRDRKATGRFKFVGLAVVTEYAIHLVVRTPDS